jgi:MFS family permease
MPILPKAARIFAIGLAVGLVLADSSIAVLALPAIHRDFRIGVGDLAWVLTSFNLALAVAAIPAGWVVRRAGATPTCIAGLAVFAAASGACALSSGYGELIAWRCVQAAGGGASVMAALDALTSLETRERAIALWTVAGLAGAALGPAAGGALTEMLSWEAVFAAQVPLALVPLPFLLGVPATSPQGASTGGRWAPIVALALTSAGLAAALFLVVLLLVEGWHLSPLAAAAVVTVLPAGAIAAVPALRTVKEPHARAGAGVLLIGGGLAALGLLPRAGWWWTVPPQILVGAGLSFALASLTHSALAGRASELRSGTTIAARHAGVVLGLVVLSPVLVGDLERGSDLAEQAGTALLVDADLSAATKTRLADAIFERVEKSAGRAPDIAPAFRSVDAPEAERTRLDAVEHEVTEMLRRVASASFSRSFLFAAALSGLALLPIAVNRKSAP